MTRLFVVATLALSGIATVGAGDGSGAGEFAGNARVVDPEYTLEAIEVLESLPPRFELILARDMPSAGWGMQVDGVRVDVDAGWVDIRVTEVPPGGMAAAVITRVRSRVELPKPLPAGRYVLTVQARRGDRGNYRPVLAEVLAAVP